MNINCGRDIKVYGHRGGGRGRIKWNQVSINFYNRWNIILSLQIYKCAKFQENWLVTYGSKFDYKILPRRERNQLKLKYVKTYKIEQNENKQPQIGYRGNSISGSRRVEWTG